MQRFKNFLLPLVLLICTTAIFAQTNLELPRNYQYAYDIAQTRSLTGLPGKNYWQNTAHYKIDVNFDPVTLLVSGTESIEYINNSPDTLHNVAFKLYPNLYKKGVPRDMSIAPEDLTDGVQLKNVYFNTNPLDSLAIRINGTNMNLRKTEILPGAMATFKLDFSYTLNRGSHIRTGAVDESSAFIAYFFPRISVYDDIDGWNRNPYLGSQEFYNDFCDFSVNITVPKNFVVWATGDLTNCQDVLQEKYCKRLQEAEASDQTIDIIDSADLADKAGITKNNAFHTWHFEATNVTDFVFAISDHYLWKSTSVQVDASSLQRTRVDVAFNPAHKDFYEVVDFARKTVDYMSYRFPK